MPEQPCPPCAFPGKAPCPCEAGSSGSAWEPEPRVRVTAAVCENCGPLEGGRYMDTGRVVGFPVIEFAWWVREELPKRGCEDCGGQVRVATEPADD